MRQSGRSQQFPETRHVRATWKLSSGRSLDVHFFGDFQSSTRSQGCHSDVKETKSQYAFHKQAYRGLLRDASPIKPAPHGLGKHGIPAAAAFHHVGLRLIPPQQSKPQNVAHVPRVESLNVGPSDPSLHTIPGAPWYRCRVEGET